LRQIVAAWAGIAGAELARCIGAPALDAAALEDGARMASPDGDGDGLAAEWNGPQVVPHFGRRIADVVIDAVAQRRLLGRAPALDVAGIEERAGAEGARVDGDGRAPGTELNRGPTDVAETARNGQVAAPAADA